MRLYIAGPMSGLPDFNYPAFHAAAQQLRDAGYEVVNPAESRLPEGSQWVDYMREGITGLITCDGLALLPSWDTSRGALLEVTIANGLGFPIRSVKRWRDNI